MRIGPFSFRPALVTTVATALFVALTVYLGLWQRDRAEEKSRRQAMLDQRLSDPPVQLTGFVASADALLYRRVAAAGEYVAAQQLFVDNQVHGGRAGFQVITPLKVRGGDAVVLVNRGWIARDAAYPKAPAVAVPPGEVEVTGLATQPPARFVELGPQAIAGDVWQNLSIARFAERTGMRTFPIVVLADVAGPGLAAVRERPDAGVAKHVEYELTWFALAATALVLWIALNIERRA